MLRLLLVWSILCLSSVSYALNPSIFLIHDTKYTYSGTGFELQTNKGVFTVTNAHVCGKESSLIAAIGKQDKLLVVKAVYTKHDLCVLQPILSVPALMLADDYYVGEMVTVEGYPRAIRAKTSGKVGRYYNLNMDGSDVVVQYFGVIDHGNSGSPVLDSNGQVIGVINTLIRSYGVSFGGMVPLEFIKDFIDSKEVY